MDKHHAPSYPVSLLISGRRCLVVGGGRIAARKVIGLVTAGAQVTVVAPEVTAEIESLPVAVERRTYRSGEVAGYTLAITATGNREVDGEVFADGERANVFVNSADDPDRCTFILPAVERFGPASVAVSTSGASPAVAVWLRDRIAAALPRDTELLVSLVSSGRTQLRDAGLATEGLGWPSLIDTVAATLGAGDSARARATVDAFVDGELARAHLGPRHHAG